MTNRTLPGAVILAAGLGMGITGDQLLRAPGGLSFFLMFLGLAASVWLVSRGEEPLSREAAAWIGVGVACAASLLWRGSEILRVGAFVAACAAFALPALHAGRAWVRRARVLDVVEALAGAGVHAGFGSVRLITHDGWDEVGTGESRRAASGVARTALGGVLLALVPLVVFGSLFISADALFATMIRDFVRLDLQVLASHLVLTAVLSWLACGYLVGVVSGTRLDVVRGLMPARPSLGAAQVATALGLVDLLFLGFVLVQVRYLFGGSALVEVTPGLTYAAYAREGFFQLVAAVALAIPWLLIAHSLIQGGGFKARSLFAVFAGIHLVLLLAIVASAVQRMLAYQDAYGLTEDRIVGTAVLVWLTAVVLWFGATVLSGRRDRFAFGGLATAFVLVAALQVIDPAGTVARHNLDRSEELGGVDAEYLARLGSDAAPILVQRLDELDVAGRCQVAERLLSRWGPKREQPWDWRSWNAADWRAREIVDAEAASLTRVTEGAACDQVENQSMSSTR